MEIKKNKEKQAMIQKKKAVVGAADFAGGPGTRPRARRIANGGGTGGGVGSSRACPPASSSPARPSARRIANGGGTDGGVGSSLACPAASSSPANMSFPACSCQVLIQHCFGDALSDYVI